MNEIIFFVLGVITSSTLIALAFMIGFNLGSGKGLPHLALPKLNKRPQGNLTDNDLVDIREIPVDTLMDSLKRNPNPPDVKTVEEDFEEELI